MPAIQSQFARFAPDLKVLAVNYDESPEQIESFARELDLGFDLLVDPGGKVSEEDYFVRAYPSSYFIDRTGVIQVVHLGLMTDAQLDDYLKRIGVE
jgi:peroxiredoxin